MPSCRSCGRPVVWAKTEAGNAIPLDAASVPGGAFVLLRGVCYPVNKPLPRGADVANRYDTHFATCPNAKAHRKASRKG